MLVIENKYRVGMEEFFYKIMSDDFIIIRFYCGQFRNIDNGFTRLDSIISNNFNLLGID